MCFYEYNEDGALEHVAEKYASGFQYEKEYSDGKLNKVTVYDGDGRMSSECSYIYDDKEKLIETREILVDENSKKIGNREKTYEYDGMGRLIQTREWCEGETFSYDHGYVYEFEYDGDNLIKETRKDENGTEFYVCEYIYDEYGNCIREMQDTTHFDCVREYRYIPWSEYLDTEGSCEAEDFRTMIEELMKKTGRMSEEEIL